MMIHIFTPSVDYNQWLKRFDTQLNEPTNKKSTIVVSPTDKKSRSYKTLGTSVRNNPMPPSSLTFRAYSYTPPQLPILLEE